MTAIDLSATSDTDVLDTIQRQVLWLATSIVHHANHGRPVASGVKVGGHQASSASMVGIVTALYIAHLQPDDLVSVKPHAAPVLHALNYLLGDLDRSHLTKLREYHGLQSYPSRTKDPDRVDFSTGSVGIGATATIWSALARRYLAAHDVMPPGGRHIALVGDAELDEGAVWEAVLDPMVRHLGELLWVVDCNRQSLDRVIPGIAVDRMVGVFESAGWHVQTVKYGRGLRDLFARPGGAELRARIDHMDNEEYQALLRSPLPDVRGHLSGDGPDAPAIVAALAGLDDTRVQTALADLGGHDVADLIAAYAEADQVTDRPSVIFAYTIKGWNLPTQGHPSNHSTLLSDAQWHELAERLGTDADDPWATFTPGQPEADLLSRAARRLRRAPTAAADAVVVPVEVGRTHAGATSTQQAFGRLLLDLRREAPAVARRVVTVSPDVATSTNLGGWINQVGVWNVAEQRDWFGDDLDRLVQWRESGQGQHVELGIAEVNLVGLLAELGLTWSRYGEPLLPIGTLYDPFVTRALEPWSFGIYGGGQSILVGTPSGVTLAPEGGAHQSIATPSIGIAQPGCVAWEPAFAQDFEWTMLHALGRLGRVDGESAYFRLSTRPIDQTMADVPATDAERARRRDMVCRGGYRLATASEEPQITVVGMGAVMPEAVAAAAALAADGVAVDVVCLTSADLLFRAVQRRRGLATADGGILDDLFPAERAAPIVTVLDGHPHALSFLGGVHGVPTTHLGVQDFGQVGDVADLYAHFGLDAATIIGAAWDLLDNVR